MNNRDFWESVDKIISEGFTPGGLATLDFYAEQFIAGRILYQRFSPREQHGCAQGGATHVAASLLAGADVGADRLTAPEGSFKREQQLAAEQSRRIELWARRTGCWTERVDEVFSQRFGEHIAEGGEAQVYYHGATLIKTIGLDYYVQPLLALDRISLHNAWFPETCLRVLGFGRTVAGDFVIVVEQAHIQGSSMTDAEIAAFARGLGFELRDPKNWTFATPDIYLSDLHDENVIRSREGNIFVLDCDIRLNTPDLRQGGRRTISNTIIDNQ